MDKEFEAWWTINKFLLMHDESVGLREIAHAGYEAGKQSAQQPRALDAATVCRQVNHFYVDGVCAECGSPEPPRQ